MRQTPKIFPLLLAVTFFCNTHTLAQKFAITINGRDRIYQDKANQLFISAGDKKCEDIIVTTDNGTLTRDGCEYNYIPVRDGNAKLTISVNTPNGVQKLGDSVLRVEEFACNPVCYLTGTGHGEIQIKKLCAAKGVKVGFLDCKPTDNYCYIRRYKLWVVRNSEIVYSNYFAGKNPEFDNQAIAALSTLENDDIVYFKDIVVEDKDDHMLEISQLRYKITKEPELQEAEEEDYIVSKILSRKVSLADTSQITGKVARKDSTLAAILINKVTNGTIKAFPATRSSASAVLSKTEIETVLAPEVDTSEAEDVDGTPIHKITKQPFDYNAINNFSVLEEWKHNKKTGKSSLTIICIAPSKDYYSDDGNYIGYKPLFWLDYNEVKKDLDNYKRQHPRHTFERATPVEAPKPKAKPIEKDDAE